MKLKLGALRGIRNRVRLAAAKVGKQPAGQEPGRSGYLVRAGAGEQEGRLPTCVRAGRYGDRVLEGNPQVLDVAKSFDANLQQRVFAVAAIGAQRFPRVAQLAVDQSHFSTVYRVTE